MSRRDPGWRISHRLIGDASPTGAVRGLGRRRPAQDTASSNNLSECTSPTMDSLRHCTGKRIVPVASGFSASEEAEKACNELGIELIVPRGRGGSILPHHQVQVLPIERWCPVTH